MTEAQLLQLMQLNMNVWQQYLPYLSAQMQLQIAQGIYSGLTTEQIIQNISGTVFSQGQLETLITTLLTDYSRSVTTAMMNDAPADEKYIYIGPLDGKTRDICVYYMAESGVDGITKAQIQGLTEGDYSLTRGGGYNCRHKWESKSEFGLSVDFFNPQGAEELRSGS